jgi:hypothetical protein
MRVSTLSGSLRVTTTSGFLLVFGICSSLVVRMTGGGPRTT